MDRLMLRLQATSNQPSAFAPLHDRTADSAAIRPSDGHPLLALVVEDESLVAQFLADVLHELNFRVCTASTAATALEQAQTAERFAVMFIDLGLPDRSGLELIGELQLFQPGVPVVISTGYGAAIERDRAEGNPYPHYLIKPYTAERVAELLDRLGLRSA